MNKSSGDPEISEKQARSIKYQITVAKLPDANFPDLNAVVHCNKCWCASIPDNPLSPAMAQSYYDPSELLIRSHLWQIEAEEATFPSMRDFCLKEAERCARMVQRSLMTPVLREG